MPPKFSTGLNQPTIMADHLPGHTRTSPCQAACPAGNPIEKLNALIAQGEAHEAAAYLYARNPLAGITGRICPGPCETACNRGSHDESLSIRDLERFTVDHADNAFETSPNKMPPSGKKIAIIGSGPAGMTCAYFSALLGHDVVVFEADPVLGGIPRVLVPEFKLPKDIVDRQVARILGLGVRARTNVRVGHDIAFETIRKDFDACLIAVGSVRDRLLDIPGAELSQPALAFLRQVNLGEDVKTGGHAVVLGGGGVAFDCAFTLKRLGATKVTILCVEGHDCMCAGADDIAQASAEGIQLLNSCLACGIRQETGRLTGVEYFEISGFSFDESCCLNVQRKTEKIHFLPADQVISAIGVLSDFSFLDQRPTFSFTPNGVLSVDPDRLSTSVEGVFAAGDASQGPGSVAAAIGSGRRAAISMHQFLLGKAVPKRLNIIVAPEKKIVFEPLEEASASVEQHVVMYEEMLHSDYFAKQPRVKTPEPSKDEPFAARHPGYDEVQAKEEAGRCLHCGQCFSCGSCVEDCPGDVLSLGPNGPEATYADECWHCGNCRISCPCGAVQYDFPLSMLV